MSNPTNTKTTESFFGEVIYSYTRAQAIEDGVLVDAGSLVKENVFKWPVALTSAAWADCVAWSDEDSEKQVHQDQSGRLWDLLYMAACEIRNSNGSGEQMLYQLFRVPRDGKATEAEIVTLKLIVGPGDQGEPVITIMLYPTKIEQSRKPSASCPWPLGIKWHLISQCVSSALNL